MNVQVSDYSSFGSSVDNQPYKSPKLFHQISQNTSVKSGMAQPISQINLDDFRSSSLFSGINGSGSTIVILDTGIDLDNPIFGPDSDEDGIADRILYSYDFFGDNDADASDESDHGSNVSSIAALVAPGSNIIHLKVLPSPGDDIPENLDPNNLEEVRSLLYPGIREALQWVNDHAVQYNIASVNMSLGMGNFNALRPEPFCGNEFAKLANNGVAVIVSAGNGFSEFGSTQGVSDFAADPNTISVGAVWGSSEGPRISNDGAVDYTTGIDRITSFSQRHRTLTDIFAPGTDVTGANSDGSTIDMTGTSQAAPQIAGIVTLAQQLAVRELGRRLTVQEFRDLLVTTGATINDGDDEDDNVVNTGLNFKRVDVFGLGQGILTARIGALPTSKNDTLSGAERDDYIAGFDGNDTLIGGIGNDTLLGGEGNDRLLGGSGSDNLFGGTGNDIYDITNLNQTITEYVDEGIDSVIASTTYILGNNLENLILRSPTSTFISGYGNRLDNIITGNQAGNSLYGHTGNDTLLGGRGDDYLVGGWGEDTLYGSVGKDRLVGGFGDDLLCGGTGNDWISGGDGADKFILSSKGIDTIKDFQVLQGDRLQVSAKEVGGGLKVGKLFAKQFTLGSAATDANDRFIYNSTTGGLFFDADGSGSGRQVKLAVLSPGLALNNRSIVVIA